ncbi:MAG: hypothetical protein KAS19_05490, partial [Anaerolineales bacterium]|nr:hypothetical protein [Anaerolineales bacterium]
MLFAGKKDAIAEQAYDPDARDARLAPLPTRPVQVDDGRALGDLLMTIDLAAIGIPAPGYAGAGLTWDGTYLYYENQIDHTMYVIDPTGPSVVDSWSTGLPHPWGVGSETNLWVSDAVGSPGMVYEYSWGGTATGNSFNSMSGGATWMGDLSEWYTPGEIAILAVGGTNEIYTFTVPGGTPITSIGDPVWTGISQRALTYDPHNHTFWLGGWNTGIIWEVDANTGAVLRQFNPADASISGLAYDWQSNLHPTPVLWLATNSPSDYIYMLDADNPQPPPEGYDFETGWQGWTNTNGQAFPAGWGVMESDYKATWQLPESGDSSMWIDSDAAGSATWVQDTALSPVLVPRPAMDWLKYGVSYNNISTGEWLEVGIKYYDGATWNVVPLVIYTADTGPMWDSVDVSA